MKSGPLTRLVVYTIFASILLVAGYLLFRALIPEPPDVEVEQARAAIATARDSQAEIYSPLALRQARAGYDSAMALWRRENERFILLRDYEQVTYYAEKALKKADEALMNSTVRSETLRGSLGSGIEQLSREIFLFEKVFTSLPLSRELKKSYARGRLLLREAHTAYENGRYVEGNVTVTEANEYITEAHTRARQLLKSYFSHFPEWREWEARTIEESRNRKSYAIVVEKIPPVCHLYHAGEKRYTFEAEFGSNWMGGKMSRGDKATPEGIYMVTRKLSGSSTRYHKALLINYPNQSDVREFNERIRNGRLPADASIGDMIEIHGHGGKGGNWTEGCVALKDSDMDILFKYVSAGTPVTIIGSNLTLEEYIGFEIK